MMHRMPIPCVSILSLAFSLGCAGETGARRAQSGDSYEEPKKGSSAAVLDDEPPAGARRFPSCGQGAPPEFPASTRGADYRAIVLFTIGPDGKPLDPCFAKVEGPLDLEAKALAGYAEWSYPVAQAGQKRERIVMYRLRPPVD